jgi:hypothetical protein
MAWRHGGHLNGNGGENDEGGRRLALAFLLRTLTTQAVGVRIAEEGDGEALLRAARAIGERFPPLAARYGLRAEPSYPGVTPGPQPTPSGWRLVLAARLCSVTGATLGVALTSLACGRPPVVSVAPPETPIDPSWRAL